MKKVLVSVVLLGLSLVHTQSKADVMEEFEGLANAIKVMECYEAGKLDMAARVSYGLHFGQWLQVEDMRQISATNFQLKVKPKDKPAFWKPATHVFEVKCRILTKPTE